MDGFYAMISSSEGSPRQVLVMDGWTLIMGGRGPYAHVNQRFCRKAKIYIGIKYALQETPSSLRGILTSKIFT